MFSDYGNLEPFRLIARDGYVDYLPHFLNAQRALLLFEQLVNEPTFQQNEIILFGKKIISIPTKINPNFLMAATKAG